jgi:hypothetical protein
VNNVHITETPTFKLLTTLMRGSADVLARLKARAAAQEAA